MIESKMLTLDEMGELFGKAQFEAECQGESLMLDYGIIAEIYEVDIMAVESAIELVTEEYEVEAGAFSYHSEEFIDLVEDVKEFNSNNIDVTSFK